MDRTHRAKDYPICMRLVFKATLFVFSQRHTTYDSFSANVNGDIRQVCEAMGMGKDEDYLLYTFRRTWGTVAQNDSGASISEVAFAMNHSSCHKVMRGYIMIDFTPAWRLNEKVLDFIFFTDRPSVRERKEEEPHFRLSLRYQVHGETSFRGKKLADLTDTDYNNADKVIAKLASQLPDDIPPRTMVMFKNEKHGQGANGGVPADERKRFSVAQISIKMSVCNLS